LKGGRRVANLVVCPTTLTYNWRSEISKFFPSEELSVFVYEHQRSGEIKSLAKQGALDILIVSYDRVRSLDFAPLLQVPYHFLVLDEGHLIKNPKTKTTIACKSIQAERKIVLSGTPIQNKVSELWSIFDFLMPNFLEDEKVFNSRYNQYLTSNIKKLSEKLEETQSFVHALNSLKSRIKPFILRRTKEGVLKDLPPKIIQDYPCEMPLLQERMYKEILDVHCPIGDSQERALPTPDQKKKGSQVMQNMILHR
jgi:TATA-binding protein-associated factor